MGIYDNDGKRTMSSVRLTAFQQQKLERICSMFGVSKQRLFADFVDSFYAGSQEVMSGKVNAYGVIKDSAMKVLDNYIELDKIKRIVPPQYPADNSRV